MSRIWRYLTGQVAVPSSPPPIPTTINTGWPLTFGPADSAGTDRPRLFDPSLRHYANAFRHGDPTFRDPTDRRRWADFRQRASDHVLRSVAESPWGDRLILRGSRLLRTWFGSAAREPGDLDWVADSSLVRPTDPDAVHMLNDIATGVLGRPAPTGIAFDRVGVVTDDIWTYERAPGRRIVFPWRAEGLPPGAVQIDVVFGEELADPARRVSIEAADGGCVSVRAASPAQSLAWKLLWLLTDSYPQGKDLFDAVLLAERFRLPLEVLDATLRRGDAGPTPVSAVGLTRDWRVDWDNFSAEYPNLEGEPAQWLSRLEAALQPTFTGAKSAPISEHGLEALSMDTNVITYTVKALARGIDEDAAFDRLPILADALEDAGCTDESVLIHCRNGGPHSRGCVVIDRLIGRQ